MKKIDETYEFLKSYINEKGYPPTIREISEAIDIKSTSTVAYYLRKLEQNNKIIKGSYKNRSIQLIENMNTTSLDSSLVVMPYIKTLTEGQPLMYEPNISNKYIMSTSLFNGLNMFLMPVKDNSMKDINIIKGDKVVVSRQNVARNGEIVVALIGTNYVVAKLFKEFTMYKLKFENKDLDPIFVEKLTILGKVVGVIRNLNEE